MHKRDKKATENETTKTTETKETTETEETAETTETTGSTENAETMETAETTETAEISGHLWVHNDRVPQVPGEWTGSLLGWGLAGMGLHWAGIRDRLFIQEAQMSQGVGGGQATPF